MRLSVLFVAVAAADPARRALGKRKQGAKALAAMTEARINSIAICVRRRGPGAPRAPEIHRPMPGIRHTMPAARGVAGGLPPQRDSRIKSPRRPPPRPRHQSPRVHGRAGAGALFRPPRAGVPSDADLRAQLLLVRRRTARPVRISSLCGGAEAPVRPFERSQINSYPVLRFFFPSLVRVRRFRAISAL